MNRNRHANHNRHDGMDIRWNPDGPVLDGELVLGRLDLRELAPWWSETDRQVVSRGQEGEP